MLLPDPGYTDYLAGVLLADAKPQPLMLKPPYYLPQWHTIDKDVLLNTRLVYLTYPNNPTGSVATKDVFDKAIKQFQGTKLKLFMILPTVHLVLIIKIQVFYNQRVLKT